MGTRTMKVLLCVFALVAIASARLNEVWTKEQTEATKLPSGKSLVHKGSHVISPLPQDYIATSSLPHNFTWCDNEGVNYCTKSLNQHIPQYCGSSESTEGICKAVKWDCTPENVA